MKTILLTNSLFYPHLGGVENSLYHIALELRHMGVQSVIMTSRRGLAGDELPDHDEIEGIPVYRFHTKKRTGPTALLTVVEELRESSALAARISRDHHIWGVVARSHICGLGAIKALPGIPSIYIPPGVAKIQSNPILLNRSGSLVRRAGRWLNAHIQLPVQHSLQRRMLSRAGHVFAFSDVMRQQIWDEFAFDGLEILHPGVDGERFRQPANKLEEPLRQLHAVAPDEIVLLIVARINPSKGIDIALKALAKLPDRFRLWIVGNGPDKSSLQKLAEELGLGQNRVQFFEPTRKPEEFYRAADLFLMTSRYEPFGQTILEAHASGLPVVGFYKDSSQGILTATEEILINGETGFLIPFGVDNLVEVLCKYASLSQQQIQTIEEKTRSYVVEKYSWERFCFSLVEKIDEMHQRERFCNTVS